MTPDRWTEVERMFYTALALPEEKRAAFVHEMYMGDPELGHEVERLLAETSSSAFLRDTDSVDAIDSPQTANSPLALWPMIGNYRPLRKIGEGGMGIVYEAEQQHPRRLVAVKVIRGSHISERDVKLFQREIQALARLKHPGIASIYEADRTDAGQHFFAMELVRGVALLDYAQSLTGPPAEIVRQRLDLFRAVCEAVSYAHQRGVIHRDLKPSNILVVPGGSDTGNRAHSRLLPDVKILDFGLARISDPDNGSTLYTEVGTLQGTLPYMSPEQARANPDEVDLRSDVYALGVMLYQLLTGRLPYDLNAVPLPEAVRIICDEPPKRPLQVSSGPGASSSGRTARLDEDLVTIMLKALEKDPWRRYQSAAALLEDIERYRTNQPILARPTSSLYQVRKMVARHKVAATFISAIVALLVAFAVTMTVQSARTARERDRALAAEGRARAEAETAKRVSEFLVDIFKVSDPSESRGNTITAREMLDRGATQVREGLKDQRVIQATLMDTIGRAYGSLGLFAEARPLLENALSARRAMLGNAHLDVAWSVTAFGNLLGDLGEFVTAESFLREGLSIRRTTLGNEHPDVAISLHALGWLLLSKDEWDEAERVLAEALRIRQKTPDNLDNEIAATSNDLGLVLIEQGKYADAERHIREALNVLRRLHGPDHPRVTGSLSSLGSVHYRQGQLERAAEFFREALVIDLKLFGDSHPGYLTTLNNLAMVLRDQGKLDEAEPMLRTILAHDRQRLGPDHPDVAGTLKNLGTVLLRSGRAREAEPLFVDALRIQRTIYPEEDFHIAGTKGQWGMSLTAQGRYERAEPLCVGSYSVLRDQLGEQHTATRSALAGVITLYEAWGKPQRAAEYRALLPQESSAPSR